MSATYEPGTVAVATFNGESNVRVTRYATGLVSGWWRLTDPDDYLNDDDDEDSPRVTDVRLLVVLDPEDREQVKRLLDELERMSFSAWACGSESCLQTALRSLTGPPKPAEPTGLGAVVEDADGVRWVLNNPRGLAEWSRENAAADGLSHDYRLWRQINAVRVLSEGIQ